MRKQVLSILACSILSGLSGLSGLAGPVAADVTYEEQTTMGGLMQMMGMGKPTKSTKISTGAIDPNVFAVPGDYKLVAGR